MKKIHKMNELKHIESFVQVNYLKGFGYIDRAGTIVNLYQREDGSVDYNMSADRMIISKPVAEIADIRVSNGDIWAHFIEPPNLGKIQQMYIKEFEKIYNIVGAGKIFKVGWRNYFVLDISGKDANKVLPIKEVDLLELSVTKDINDITLRCRVRPVLKKEDSSPALLFDLDALLLNQDIKDIPGVNNALKRLKDELRDNEVKNLINNIVENI